MEKEFLSIVTVLEVFSFMLLGDILSIYTDCNNLTFVTLHCCHILHWCSYMDVHGPTIHYHPGKKIDIADKFSQLPCYENAPVFLFDFTCKGPDNLLECIFILQLPNVAENNPIELEWIHYQKRCKRPQLICQ